MAASAEELKASLEGHNAEFEALLRLIPAKYYLVPEDSGEHTSKYQKNSKKQKAPKQAIKEATKKAKRDKLDPANNKSIVELQEEAAFKKNVAASKKKGKNREPSDAEDEAGSDVEDLELDMNGMDVDDGEANSSDDNDASEEGDNAAIEYKPMAASGSIETLRAKLHARMEELRQKKGPKNRNGGVNSKDELLEERRMQRAAMRERRRKETKEKIRREEEERGKKGKGKEKQKTTSSQTTKTQLLVPDVSGRPGSSDASSKYTNVAFSALSGTTPSISKSLKTSSNPTQALAQLSKRAEARASLPTDKRKELEERDAWAKAGARVTGAKVHDDAARLQKAAKRREKEKGKSKKEWDTRKEELAKAQAARQKKRADNIATRHEKRKGAAGAKGGAGKKDTKRRPGFEGKSFGSGSKKAGVSGKGKGRK